MSATNSAGIATALQRHRNSFLLSRHEADLHVPNTGVGGGSRRHDSGGDDDPLVLIVLNTKGNGESKSLFRHLWDRATLRICADGGANRLHDGFEGDDEAQETADMQRARYVPDVIVGDLDSLRPEVSAFYRGLGAEVKIHEDQDHNDFEKCLMEVERRLGTPCVAAPSLKVAADIGPGAAQSQIDDTKRKGNKRESQEDGKAERMAPGRPSGDTFGNYSATIVGLGAFGGRFDHEMAAINVLHAYANRFTRLVLMGAGNVAFLLAPGINHVIEPDARFEGPTIGLIPIGGACRSVTTEGLRWNLHCGHLEFGAIVSSSNCIDSEEVRVTTDAPLVWTTEFKSDEWAKCVN